MLWKIPSFLLFCSHVSTIVKAQQLGVDTGAARADEPFWLEVIKHQGSSPYNPDPSYQVFRNVKDFGAVGDGITDDTFAINQAISYGNRCGGNDTPCNSSTIAPALVYVPKGEYRISSPVTLYYYTQLIGDATSSPVLRASEDFEGIAVIDANPYKAGGSQWFENTENNFRSVRNFVIDVRSVPPQRSQGTGIHWQVARATSLINIVFEMSSAPDTAHQGIWMENGSGGFMSDLVFNGGKFGMWVGSQQFTARNVTINNAQTAILHHWDWAWTFQGITINDCWIGFDLLSGVSAVSLVDTIIRNTVIAVHSAAASEGQPKGSLIIDNMHLENVKVAIADSNGHVILGGGASVTIPAWGQGNMYAGYNSTGNFNQGLIDIAPKPSSLLDREGTGRVFGKSHPQYADFSVQQFVSAKSNGARGDGVTDDTAALQSLLNRAAGHKIIFLNAGTYIVRSTLTIPAGTRLVGEAWSVIAGKGAAFSDQNKPRPVVKVGGKLSRGIVEITDVVFTTVGPSPGAIIVEWNIKEPAWSQGGAGMWDSHIRLGGAAGTELEVTNCPAVTTDTDPCMASFLALHLTHSSSTYIEGLWIWSANRDLDAPGNLPISIYSGRGILSESKGPVWMNGITEHSVLYQYRFVEAENHIMGVVQSSTPYWQPVPTAPRPFVTNPTFKDPSFTSESSAWGVTVKSSRNILAYGGVFSSFFNNRSQTCLETRNCQSKITDFSSDSRDVSIYSMSTIGSNFQISVDDVGVVKESDNVNGFVSTIGSWVTSKFSDPYFEDGGFEGAQVRINA